MKYDINAPWKNLDPWQKEVLETKGNIVLRSGRQVGKSAIISIKVGEYALKNPGKKVMVIAKTERQANLLFNKTLAYIYHKNRSAIRMGVERPTKHELKLKNGTIIYCLPAGDTGYGIMGYTIDLLVADEAAFIPEEVWNSVIPTLTITRGQIILLSTPFIKEGYYYKCFEDPSFSKFHMSSEDCPRKDQEFLDYQKSWMTREQYAQMYLGKFLDNFRQLFSDELIHDRCIAKSESYTGGDKFLGVDVARMGEDDTTFEGLWCELPTRVKQFMNHVTKKTMITETVRTIIRLNEQHNFNKIGIDDGGMGVGVLDPLLEDSRTKYKVIGLNNAKRSIDPDGRTKGLMKEDMYHNLLGMMERGEIDLLDDDEVKASLKCVQYDDQGRINGQDTHIVEGLIRGAYCIKAKGLNLFCVSG